ncbi:MAG: DNA polymerase III subunit delta [Bacteroidetes bacterium]|nr:DNA polymerase III subunit delta [Bacteroidota bacterium]
MATDTGQELIKKVKAGSIAPVYLLQGDEPYFIDVVSDALEQNLVDEGMRDFDQIVMYGKDIDLPGIIANARRMPMISPRMAVIIKEAQEVKSWKKEEECEALINYLKKPSPTTTLVFVFKSKPLDKRTKLYKTFKEKAEIYEGAKLKEEQIPQWITQYLKAHNHTISPDANHMLAEYLGSDLNKLSNELDKLMINIKGGEPITTKEIENNVGISKEFNVFELQKALAMRDIYKANLIANYFAANPKSNPIVLTLGALHSYFTKVFLVANAPATGNAEMAKYAGISPYFLSEYQTAARNFDNARLRMIASWIRDTDLKSKGVGNISTEDGDLLKELVWKILH